MGDNIWILVILGVLLVGMIVMTIIPQKKRQKQQQEMMNNLVVGAKIMTIGRMVGKIVAINTTDNTLILNVGTEENPTLISIEKNGVGIVLDAVKPTPVENEVVPIPVEEYEAKKAEADTEETVFEEEVKTETPAAKKPAAKKPAAKKPAAKKPVAKADADEK